VAIALSDDVRMSKHGYLKKIDHIKSFLNCNMVRLLPLSNHVLMKGSLMDISNDHTHPDWLVGNPSGLGQFSSLWMGSVGLLVLGLQPILLGALFNDGRVTFDQLALAATFEILAIGIGSVIAAFLISTKHLPAKSLGLLLAVFLCNLLTAYASSASMITLWRSLAGFLEGGLVAISVELIARSRLPERFGGYFVSLQTGLQCIMALILSQWIIPTFGSSGGFMALAFFCLISLPFAGGVPRVLAL